jgi:hypothetical protein
MSISTIAHQIIDGIHHLIVSGEHAVETVRISIDARPGLKADLNTLFGPIKDAVIAEFTKKFEEFKAASPAEAPALFKAAIPDILGTVKQSFVAQATHAGNVDVMLSLAAAAGEASLGLDSGSVSK